MKTLQEIKDYYKLPANISAHDIMAAKIEIEALDRNGMSFASCCLEGNSIYELEGAFQTKLENVCKSEAADYKITPQEFLRQLKLALLAKIESEYREIISAELPY